MTGLILPFVGIPERTAKQNMAAFIRRAKAADFFKGPGAAAWHENSWDLQDFAMTRGQNPGGYTFHFTTYNTSGRGRRAKSAVDLELPFLDQAKALVVDKMVSKGMQVPSQFLPVLRIIEMAFRQSGISPNLCAVTPAILDKAAEIIRADISEPWNYGRVLERLALETLNGKCLSNAHLIWRSPFPYRGAQRSDRVDPGGAEVGAAARLPHLKSVLDLAGVFQGATVGADVVTSGWFALAMYAPSRGNEILTLPLRCETEMGGIYGLAWQPSKGGDPMTKFATTPEWADVASVAIGRLRDLGATARVAAKWYAEHPGQLYLPEGFEAMRGQPLTKWEIRNILGMPGKITNHSRLERTLVNLGGTTSDPGRTGGGAGLSSLYDFASVEAYVSSVLPRGWPFADKKNGLLAHDALFCLPRHVMLTGGGVQLNVPDLISRQQIFNDLGGKPTGTTVFARHGLTHPDTGETWRLATHGPRHLLNTLAQSKHLSEALIAFWSGRKRVDQNRWYNHIPHEAFIEAYVAMGQYAPREMGVVGPLADKIEERKRREMVSYEEALRLEIGSVITTRYGLCRHNYALTPCPKDKDCIACGENTFIKGDARQLVEATKQYEISTVAVINCLIAIDLGEPGVDRWLRKHQEAEARWKKAVEMLSDDSIPDGTLVTLPPPEVSQTKAGLALAVRAVQVVGADAAGCLDDDLALGGNL